MENWRELLKIELEKVISGTTKFTNDDISGFHINRMPTNRTNYTDHAKWVVMRQASNMAFGMLAKPLKRKHITDYILYHGKELLKD